jgi:single-strand DNA-binding protein
MTGATVTITGRLTADPVLRTTNGKSLSVANFTVAQTPRRQNENGDWEDAGDTLFLRVTAWRDLADNAASSLHKGDLVVIIGRLGVRHYPKNDGTTGTEVTCDADSIAVDLRFQTAVVTRFSTPAAPATGEPWAAAGPVASAA